MHAETMLAVRDVRASTAWYKRLLGARNDHDGPEFDRILAGDRVLLMLHKLDAEEHPALAAPGASPGSGVLLYLTVDDVHAVHARALEMAAEVVDEPHRNPQARQTEFSLRDPDGYSLSICTPD